MIYTCTYNPAIDYKLELDNLVVGDLNRTNMSIFTAGGKGINVSIVLNRLEVENVSIGFVGGFSGKYFVDYLKEKYDLNTSFIEVSGKTRINVKLNTSGTETEINARGPKISLEELNILLSKIDGMSENDVLVIGGSVARGVANSYLDLVKKCKSKNIEFIIDTNKDNLLEVLTYQPLLVKPNLKELEELFDVSIKSQAEIIRYANKLLDKGAKNVIVSLGANGSLLINREAILQALPIIGDVKNTVGAGDSMVAGFVCEYMKSSDAKEAFKKAVAAGTATAFSYGLAKKADVLNYYHKVEIKEVKE